jgi:peptidoglycan-N-acetylglucosamine deacetylase
MRWRVFLLADLASKIVVACLFPSHPWAAAALFVAPELWLAWQLLVPNTRGLGPVFTRFATTQREVWLTIDDGPDPATTRRVLDLLDSHRARATFFLIGDKAMDDPALVREILGRGHTVGNHTQRHPLAAFWLAGPRRVAAEIDDCTTTLHAAGAGEVRWFRSPAGIKSVFLFPLLAARGLAYIGWASRGRESTSRDAGPPLARLKRGVQPGAILLTHESGGPESVRLAVLTGILEHLTAEGYACVLPPRESLL